MRPPPRPPRRPAPSAPAAPSAAPVPALARRGPAASSSRSPSCTATGCEKTLEDALALVEGVEAVLADHETKLVLVTLEADAVRETRPSPVSATRSTRPACRSSAKDEIEPRDVGRRRYGARARAARPHHPHRDPHRAERAREGPADPFVALAGHGRLGLRGRRDDVDGRRAGRTCRTRAARGDGRSPRPAGSASGRSSAGSPRSRFFDWGPSSRTRSRARGGWAATPSSSRRPLVLFAAELGPARAHRGGRRRGARRGPARRRARHGDPAGAQAQRHRPAADVLHPRSARGRSSCSASSASPG